MYGTPKVSVLLPVFNAEKYLNLAVESVLNQSLKDFELIIIDDGSTDGSFELLKSFERRDSRIRLFSRSNKGLIETLNEGIGYCNAQYVARMDADDICMPQRLLLQYDFLEEKPDHVAVGTQVLFIDEGGWPICLGISLANSHSEIDSAHLNLKGGAITHPSVMLRANAVRKIGGYHNCYPHAEDLDLFLRLAEIGLLENMSYILLNYRIHIDSIGHRYRKQQVESSYRAVRDAYRRRGQSFADYLEKKPKVQLQSYSQFHNKCAWWALSAGNLKTARKHACLAFMYAPFSYKNIRLIFCSVRGR